MEPNLTKGKWGTDLYDILIFLNCYTNHNNTGVLGTEDVGLAV